MEHPNPGDGPDVIMKSDLRPEDAERSLHLQQMEQMLAKVQQSDQKMAELMGHAERMHNMMAEANARAERAEAQARTLAEKLEELRVGPSGALDVVMPPVVSRSGMERQEVPQDELYEAGDEGDPDEEAEIENVQATLLPANLAGIHFRRTIIGAGPVLRLKDVPTRSNAPTSAIPTTANLNLPGGNVGTSSEMNVSRTEKYGAPKSREFKLPPQRFTTPDRTARLASVRNVMNKFFDIAKDADVLFKPQADETEVEAFENDEGPGPTPPYLPDWFNIKGAWNHALLLLFMEEYAKQYTIENEEDQDVISKMFMDRLFRLRKNIKHVKRRAGETNTQLSQRYLAMHARVLREQRRNSRRNETFETRSRITVQNRMAQRGEAKDSWEHLDSILETLGAGGMSSDESELDSDGRKVYYVKGMSWRRKTLTARMIIIDRDRNITTAYNNTRPGNPPRLRKRRNNPTDTARNALPGLPINFYDRNWYSQLTDRQKKEIRAVPAVELFEIVS
ncbi:hypothetical protein BDZ97DRAFT_1760015 [Flammula alnicola]|nr:hypothetical protein BDZ97DRAFT_1760015 [Flammula alnicola]